MSGEQRVQLGGLPRPGPGLKLALGLVAGVALLSAVVEYWIPGGDTGKALVLKAVMLPDEWTHQPWALLTSGLMTAGLGHVVFSLIGLYFLSPDLEKAMGKWRFLRFLAMSVVFGNVLGIAADLAMPESLDIFHPRFMFGPGAAIAATAIAWAKANSRMQIRFMFFLPMSGKMLYYATIGLCLLAIVFHSAVPEGVVAPFGGILTGMFFAGNPSPARAAWLRVKLFFLRRQKNHVSAESLLEDRPSQGKAKKKGGPELRVVLGGLEEKLKDQPPKDKRYLN
jgi:membrane associated rhomboid family serine protease